MNEDQTRISRRSAITAAGMIGAAVGAGIANPALAYSGKKSPKAPAKLSLEDRAEIQDLFTEYLWAYDCSDVDGFISLFSPDGRVIGHGTVHADEPAMRKWFTNLLKMRDDGDAMWLHEAGQFKFEGDSERCVVYAYATHFYGSPASAAYPAKIEMGVRSLGYFINECVKVDGQWKFRHLTINRFTNNGQPWKRPKPWEAQG